MSNNDLILEVEKAPKEITRKSPPWIKAMVSALDAGTKKGQKLLKTQKVVCKQR